MKLSKNDPSRWNYCKFAPQVKSVFREAVEFAERWADEMENQLRYESCTDAMLVDSAQMCNVAALKESQFQKAIELLILHWAWGEVLQEWFGRVRPTVESLKE
jgi:hypothetical protein